MSLYQKLTKVMDDRDVEGYVALIHEDAEIVFHKSGNKFTKNEWASMVVGMMGNPKFVNNAVPFSQSGSKTALHRFM